MEKYSTHSPPAHSHSSMSTISFPNGSLVLFARDINTKSRIRRNYSRSRSTSAGYYRFIVRRDGYRAMTSFACKRTEKSWVYTPPCRVHSHTDVAIRAQSIVRTACYVLTSVGLSVYVCGWRRSCSQISSPAWMGRACGCERLQFPMDRKQANHPPAAINLSMAAQEQKKEKNGPLTARRPGSDVSETPYLTSISLGREAISNVFVFLFRKFSRETHRFGCRSFIEIDH